MLSLFEETSKKKENMKLGLPICLILVWASVHEANTGKIDGINLSQLEPEEYALMEVLPSMDKEPEEYGLMEVPPMDRELVQSEDRGLDLRA